jgi:hypothetical protein
MGHNPSYEIIPRGSKKNMDLLLDGLGYSYIIKSKFPNSTTWMCTRRSGTYPCRATVRQQDRDFIQSKKYLHSRDNEIHDKVKIRQEVKKRRLKINLVQQGIW